MANTGGILRTRMKEQIRDKKFDRMMIEAIQKKYSFFAWNSLNGVIEKIEFVSKAYRYDYNEIELEMSNLTNQKISSIISGDKLVNFYIPELSISFTSELKIIKDEARLRVYLPKEYSFYDRRAYDRVEPDQTCFVQLEMNKLKNKKSIFDIGLGGFSIILPKSDKFFVEKGKEIANIKIEIPGFVFNVKAVCVNNIIIDRFKVDSLPYGGFKLAFKFSEIAESDLKILKDYIAQEYLKSRHLKAAN